MDSGLGVIRELEDLFTKGVDYGAYGLYVTELLF